MPQTHDYAWNEKKFITHLVYPKFTRPRRRPPLWEFAVTINETEPPFRQGFGWAFRIPFTRIAIIFGKWLDAGGDEDERLRQALKSRDAGADVIDIREW
jgi:hypothetical protein